MVITFTRSHTIGVFSMGPSQAIGELKHRDHTKRLFCSSARCLYIDKHHAAATCAPIHFMMHSPEFEPSTTEDPPCREAMHVKSVERSNFLQLVWCGN
ncbi:hypothetical protein TNCV_2822901 [Trichonephila clavipes]|nr:hypothetical protein TNCV_2822901 [Trichonephila clavipes]